MDTLRIHPERAQDALILHMVGRLTGDQAEPFRKAFQAAWRPDARCILVELSGSPYMDSAGLALLLLARQRAHRAGKGFVLAGLNPQARQLLQMTRLDKILDAAPASDAESDRHSQDV